MASGIYYLKVLQNNKSIATGKLIVQEKHYYTLVLR